MISDKKSGRYIKIIPTSVQEFKQVLIYLCFSKKIISFARPDEKTSTGCHVYGCYESLRKNCSNISEVRRAIGFTFLLHYRYVCTQGARIQNLLKEKS